MTGRFVAGDPLRAYAMTSVFTIHASIAAVVYTGYGDLLGPLYTDLVPAYGGFVGNLIVAQTGALLVFFALSGYLISRPFLRALVLGRPQPAVLPYVRNRLLRIMPAYWVTIAVTVALVMVLSHPLVPPLQFEDVARLLVLDSEIENHLTGYLGQVWSLEIEMKFYLLLPVIAGALALLARVARRGGPRVRATGVVILLAVAFYGLSQVVPETERQFFPFAFMLSAFLPGIALAAVEPVLAPRAGPTRALRVGAALTFAGAVAWMFCLTRYVHLPGLTNLAMDRLAAGAIVGAPLVLQWSGAPAWRLLDNRPAHWFGQRSYSFFLLHLLVVREVLILLDGLGKGYKVTLALGYPAAFALTALLAAGMYAAVERPALEWKRRRSLGAWAEPQPRRPADPDGVGHVGGQPLAGRQVGHT
jgi:peptidoglycan/LPS O-acetylase OafA/YrhL